ncbi:MAG: hypothetical protein JO256_11345, partial [Alphaproteobacteria bacterium]|nr:hypothetical protein [Alphaproteobacteria bacterium]
RSFTNNLGEGLKLEIPETGVSLSELDRFLREKLGHDLHIGGEMVQTAKGVALTARAGTDSATVSGAEADLDILLQKLAEQIYRTTQPYRYATWLNTQDRHEEAVAVFKPLAAAGPPQERGWAYIGLGNDTVLRRSPRAALALYRRGQALDPDNFLLAADLGAVEIGLGHEEEGTRDIQAAQSLLATHGRDYALPDRIASGDHAYRSTVLRHRGALLEAYQERMAAAAINTAAGNAARDFLARTEMLALLHETSTARTVFAERLPPANGNIAPNTYGMLIAMAEQDWKALLAPDKDFEDTIKANAGLAEYRLTVADPLVAIALAHLGMFEEAQARLRPMPADCYPCLRARAQVASLQGQSERADWWFARAAAAAPTAPYAEAEWGQALLARGNPDGAIAHFTAANRIGPHFADPLEGWGEALMAKNHSHLALAKFAEADKYAPNWGRLHLKWGEALVWAGKPTEAKAQFAHAAALDLTASEKAELARALRG